MTGDTYFLLSFLKGLDDLGAAPPMTLPEFLQRVADAGVDTSLIETIFLGDDLLQRQAFLSGETEEVELAVLSSAQGAGEESLPDFLILSGGDVELQDAGDWLWARYYRHAADVAERCGSRFLKSWVGYEVGLRNALAVVRAKALGIDPHPYLVVEELGDDRGDFDAVIGEWTAAPDPLVGLQVLDQARWRWISENDDWFSFEDDELAAYATKLMLLKRWKRLSEGASRKV